MPSCKTSCAGAVAGLAALIGFMKLSVPNPLLMASQRGVLRIVDLAFDQMQDPSADWAEEFNGSFLPASPTPSGIVMEVVAGAIPADIDGVYMRVGPNAKFYPPTKRTHVFDGDGFVHSVRLAEGKATYHADYLQTPRVAFEEEMGREYFGRLGEIHGKPGLPKALLGSLKLKYSGLDSLDAGTANTALGMTPCGHTWGLNEVGRPFRFKVGMDGKITSIGVDNLSDTLDLEISAHPKYDYHSGDTFFHGKDLAQNRAGGFHVGHIREEKLVAKVQLPIGNGFQHDMFITKDYVVVIDGSMRFDPKNAILRKPLWNFDPAHMISFFVYDRALPFTAANFIKITAPFSGEIVHTLYASNTGGRITLHTPVGFYEEGSDEGVLGGMDGGRMRKIVIDVAAKSVVMHQMEGGDDCNTDFGRVRDDLVAAEVPAKFGFSSLQQGKGFNFTGLLKWDLQAGRKVGEIQFGAGVVGGEGVFVPRGERGSDVLGDEGYLAMFLWDTINQKSHWALFDAKTFAPAPALLLALPRKVPLGFHGWWLSKTEMEQQLSVA